MNAHYLVAVAHARSNISNDLKNGRVGPFAFTAAEWEAARQRAVYEGPSPLTPEEVREILKHSVHVLDKQGRVEIKGVHASADDLMSWHAQTRVFAAITRHSILQLLKSHKRDPEAAELYCDTFAESPSNFQELANEINEAMDVTAPLIADVLSDIPAKNLAALEAEHPEGPFIRLSSGGQSNKSTYQSPLPQGVKSGQYRVWYGTNRRPIDAQDSEMGFSSEPDTEVHFGCCSVFIPASHIIGHLGSPWWRRLLRGRDDRLRVLKTSRLGESVFWQDISELSKLLEPGRRHAVIFIHGYNTSFHEAAVRAAQIGYDLSINGPMAFFSWPSQGKATSYPVDEDAIEQSELLIL